MPAVAQTMQLTAWQLAMWAAVLVAAVAVMVHLLRRDLAPRRTTSRSITGKQGTPSPGVFSAGIRPAGTKRADDRGERQTDSVFWDAFGGAVVILPAMLIPSLVSPPAGLLLLVLGAATAVCVVLAGRQLEVRESRQPWRQPWRQPGYADAEALHDVLVARWIRYEMDPGQSILFPAMTDVRIPQTAELIRAMRDAALCRKAPGADYPAAVERLGRALREAERTAGVPDRQ